MVWGVTTLIVFFAQRQAQAGVGAWPIGLSGALTIFIAFLAFLKRGDIKVTRVDWVFFLAALLSLPLWYWLGNTLWTVVILTLVDLLGFGPTLRKAYNYPHQENPIFFGLFMVRNILVILALESYSLSTVLFPGAVAIACLSLIVVIACRRRVLSV